jgi:histidine triad (HIT) family protein
VCSVAFIFKRIKKIRIEKIDKIRDNRKRTYYINKEENSMVDCIFCKIANGEIPSATLYEDEEFRVILDLGPASKGHALILPKTHAANIYELSDETAGKAMILAKHMASKMTDALGCEGFNIVQNNGEIAGQTVFHFHMHLIPRYKGDKVGLTWTPGKLTDEVKDEILAKIK